MVAQAVAAITLGLLGTSGVAKLVDPAPTTGAMAAARLPSSDLLTRGLGITEAMAATAALVLGGATVLAAGVLYTGFAMFTIAALSKRIPIQSCGCFGRDDTAPTWIHVVFNVVAALALFSLPVLGLQPIDWAQPGFSLVVYVGFTAVGVYASYLLLALLPRLLTPMKTT